MSITSYEIFKDSLLCSDKKFQSPYDVFNDFFLYSDKKSQLLYDVFNYFFLYSDKNLNCRSEESLPFGKKVVVSKSGV